MTDTLFSKSIILQGSNVMKFPLEIGLEKTNRINENNENYCTLYGTKEQINGFLQRAAKDLISERCRTLNNIPKARIINSTAIRIQ